MSRRDAIVVAAARFFAERGYAAVGMRDVAEAVGVRGASLYHHFASKEEILYAICLTVTQEPNAQNLPLLDTPGTAADRLSALVRGHLHRRRTEHIVGPHELAALAPEHRAVVDEHRRCYQRRVREVIAAGVAAGESGNGRSDRRFTHDRRRAPATRPPADRVGRRASARRRGHTRCSSAGTGRWA